jgi:hypothetical protein
LLDWQKAERFAVFATPAWGFRALCVVLRNYKILYGLETVKGFVTRFAPPSENPTAAYIAFVADNMAKVLGRDVKPGDKIDVRDPDVMFALAKSIAQFETGSWEPYWTDAQLHSGMALAGCEAPTAAVA